VLLADDGHVKLTDFGLSKVLARPSDTTKTFCGTPEYLGECLQTVWPQTVWLRVGNLLYAANPTRGAHDASVGRVAGVCR
jgi:hypothetical protein